MGNVPGVPGLRGHGRVRVPLSSRQQGGHGVQVPAVPPGAGGAPADPAGGLGRAGGALPGPPGPPPPDGHGLRLRAGLPPLQPGGDGLAVLQRLSNSHLHRNAQLEPLPVGRPTTGTETPSLELLRPDTRGRRGGTINTELKLFSLCCKIRGDNDDQMLIYDAHTHTRTHAHTHYCSQVWNQ